MDRPILRDLVAAATDSTASWVSAPGVLPLGTALALLSESVEPDLYVAHRKLVVLARDAARAAALRAFPTIELVEADLLKPGTLRGALTGVDRALLLSAPDPRLVEAQTGFIDAATEAGVEHVIKFSGLSAADVATPFVFGSMHAEIETYLEKSGMAWTHLRPSQFMTEYLREVPTILAQDALYLPLKDAKLVPVDVTDIARAVFLLLTTPGHEEKTYAMSGPEALSMDEVARKISAAIGRTIHYIDVDREDRNSALLAAGVPDLFVAALDAQTDERLLGRESVVHLETHEALGLVPTSFSDFATRNAAAFLGETIYTGLK